MLSVDEALQRVLARAHPLAPVPCSLDAALGLALAEDVAADVDSPPYDKSLVDGYAVVAADIIDGRRELDVVEEVPAGALPSRTVTRGTATRIMTGAPMPAGANAVVMVEQTESLADDGSALGRVRCFEPTAAAGQNIMPRAASMARGEIVLRAGCQLRAIEIGLLAEVGRTQALVTRRPTLGVVATGNELVPAAHRPGPGQIRNSNGPMLVAAARAAGATAIDLGIGRDVREQLSDRIAAGLCCDMLVVSGGVSAGTFDLVPEVFQQLGVEQIFHKVSLKPGKPLWFGVLSDGSGEKLVFGLPGNPVSSMVCFELFVRPAIGRVSARGDTSLPRTPAALTIEYMHRGDRPTYHPARLTQAADRIWIEPLCWRGSGDLRTLTEANALACFPPGQRTFRAGETITALRNAHGW